MDIEQLESMIRQRGYAYRWQIASIQIVRNVEPLEEQPVLLEITQHYIQDYLTEQELSQLIDEHCEGK